MVCDGVANIVIRLQESGFDPRRSAPTRGSRAARPTEARKCALSITRDEHNHVLLECRSTQNCQNAQIFGALGFTNDHLYAETPDWLISRLGAFPSGPRPSRSPRRPTVNWPARCGVERPEGSDGTSPPDERVPGADALAASGDGSQDAMPGQFEVRAEGDTLPSQALSPFPLSSPISSDSPIEQMLGSAPGTPRIEYYVD